VCENPGLYAGLSDRLLEAAQAIRWQQRAASVTDEKAASLLSLLRQDGASSDADSCASGGFG
jgi:hypothetical protein